MTDRRNWAGSTWRGALLALLLPFALAEAVERDDLPPVPVAAAQVTLEQILRENAHFFGMLVNFAFTAGVSDPVYGIDSKNINVNLISREVRDPQGRQLVRVRVAGVVQKNNNVELSMLGSDGILVGKGFLGYDSGQLEFFTAQGVPIIQGYIDSGGYFTLKDLRLQEGTGILASGYVNTCFNCGALGYAWYAPGGYLVGGGRIFPAWYNGDYTKLRVQWTFENGKLDDARPSYGGAEYDLGREVTGAINSSLFDSSRPASSFFANPYNLISEPVGKSYIPRFTDNTGLAVTNPSSRENRITLTARRFDGRLVSGDGIQNPVTYRFMPGQQVAAYPSEFFRGFSSADRRPLLAGGEVGWIEMASNEGDVQALFLEGDGAASALDGNVGAEAGGSAVVFPHLEMGPSESTEIVLVNLSYDESRLSLELLDRDGKVLSEEREFYVAGRGLRNFYLGGGSSFLPVSDPSRVTTLRVRCTASTAQSGTDCAKVIGLATYRDRFRSISTSYAVRDPDAGSALVGAHFATGGAGSGEWTTTVRVTKSGGGVASVYLDLYASDGTLLTTLREVLETGGQATYVLSPSSLSWSGRLTSGYLRVRSDFGKVAGDVSISWSDGQGSLSSSYPLSSYLSRVFAFNQVAQGVLGEVEYWTGLALMNDLNRPVQVEVQIFTPNGTLDRTVTLRLEPYVQVAALLTEMLKEPSYQRIGGCIRLTASDPITSAVLYGDAGNRFLASVPGIPR